MKEGEGGEERGGEGGRERERERERQGNIHECGEVGN